MRDEIIVNAGTTKNTYLSNVHASSRALVGAHGRGLMHEITILSTMGHALHLPGRSHASDLALYRDKSNALHSMKDVMHHRIQTQF